MEAKFWLWPEGQLACNDGFDAKTLRSLPGLVEQRRDAIAAAWNEFFGEAERVAFDDDGMWIDLFDGRRPGVPLAWLPRLLNASSQQRAAVRIGARGLHWDDLDEDISIEGLLSGRNDQTRPKPPNPRAA